MRLTMLLLAAPNVTGESGMSKSDQNNVIDILEWKKKKKIEKKEDYDFYLTQQLNKEKEERQKKKRDEQNKKLIRWLSKDRRKP